MFRVAQISDTHLSAAKPYFVASFERICAAISAGDCDLAINTGDVSLNGADDDADLVAARRLHDATGLPVRFIPGNHDIGDSQDVPVASGHPAQPIDDARRRRWLRHFGPDWWSLDIPGWRLIGIDSQLMGSDLPAAAEQRDFIAAAGAGANGRRVALFTHKPLCDRQLDEDRIGGRFINPGPRRSLLAALADNPPALIASGHVHQFRAAAIDDGAHGTADHVWAPSTGFVIPDAHQPRYGLKQVGYVEHRFHADGRHEAALILPPGVATLSIADFPEAYGQIRPSTVVPLPGVAAD